MKKFSVFAFAFCAVVLISDKAHAVGERCVHDTAPTPDEVLLTTNQPGLQTCSTDAVGMSYTFNTLGVCEGYPTLAGRFANCQAFLNEETIIDLEDGSGNSSISGFIPDAGAYDHFFAITGSTFKVKGQLTMASAVLASNADSSNVSTGVNCRPKSGSYTTDTILNYSITELATSFSSDGAAGLASLIPFVCDSTAADATAEFTINNLALTGGFANTLNIDGNQWSNGLSEDAEVNVLLLNAQDALATSAATVTQVLFIKDNGSDLNIPSGHDNVAVLFNVTNALQIFYICGTEITTVTEDPNINCALLAPMLGEAAFTPTITTSN